MVDEQLLKQLKVKTGVVKRYGFCSRVTSSLIVILIWFILLTCYYCIRNSTLKELTMYVKEEVREKERYEQKRAEGKSPNDLAQQEKVIQESTAMITDSRKRLSSSTAELKKIIVCCCSMITRLLCYNAKNWISMILT
jgi:hypothetical protein